MSPFRGAATRIAALQMEIQPGNRDENLTVAANLLNQAAARNVDLACLPGTFATGLNLPTIKADATTAEGPVVHFLTEQARAHSMHIVAGVLLREAREIYDAAVLVGPGGDVLGWHRRPSVWVGEADYISQGSPSEVIATSVGRIGLQVSYDLRFPEASRHFVHDDVEILACVANFFAPFSQPVPSICRARAADSECVLVLASSAGSNRFVGMRYLGRSMIVNGLVAVLCSEDKLAHWDWLKWLQEHASSSARFPAAIPMRRCCLAPMPARIPVPLKTR